MSKNTPLFALDIGTRSVVGIVLEEYEGQYKVIDLIAQEHSERAMLDGQIHDVLAVSQVICKIKDELEKRHGVLQKVCVAAAGRSLRTERAKFSVNISGKPMIKKEDIIHLELSAVQQAQHQLAEKDKLEKSYNYYCVGYSVIHYQLDEAAIGNLIDQQGEYASVEVIATFLPKVVVESLLAALHRTDLEMEALTLEPIAAINVLIPQTMRRLNVALVDIGAGTSDIAITDEGTVVAYGMVPIAGDEITEAVSDEYLLDFPLAEKAKRDLYLQSTITITDILGFETEIIRDEVIDKISYAIDRLASAISDEILLLNNQKPPKAVMLVGGGSLTPDLPRTIAEKLQLPENRVAVRGIDAIQNLQYDKDMVKGPEWVTPIGIAIAAKQNPIQYITVDVNERTVRMFQLQQLSVGDCLLSAGVKLNKLYGKPGQAIIVKINNQQVTIPGTYGHPPVLLKNGEPCSLEDIVHNGDALTVERGTDGQCASITINELLEDVSVKTVYVNDTRYDVKPVIYQNDKIVEATIQVQDHDHITYVFPKTIKDLLNFVKLEQTVNNQQQFTVTLNHKTYDILEWSSSVLLNGKKVNLLSHYSNNDHISITHTYIPTLEEISAKLEIDLNCTLQVFFEDQLITLEKVMHKVYRDNLLLRAEDRIYPGDNLTIEENHYEPFIFQDIFRYVDISIPQTSNSQFLLLRNNEEVGFDTILNAGDKIHIKWL
ncbi:cell division protein [Bacillus sp. HMF5848]|uniref:cell division protein FtsA n=1 Tax=Bacillus sp. HMF5848 TaxID=2495421 RepID=UPI000F7A9138|nr:cell division protein FtsA [Bacillus sp. HMF5848]RSK28201.1 cell division protein [Bacillus sp. HMF5848]